MDARQADFVDLIPAMEEKMTWNRAFIDKLNRRGAQSYILRGHGWPIDSIEAVTEPGGGERLKVTCSGHSGRKEEVLLHSAEEATDQVVKSSGGRTTHETEIITGVPAPRNTLGAA